MVRFRCKSCQKHLRGVVVMANPEQTLQQASVGSKTRSAIYALKKLRIFVEVFFYEKYVEINSQKRLNDKKKGYMTKK